MLNKTKSESVKGPRHDPTVPFEESETPLVTKYRGLCQFCERAGDCTFPRDEARPVAACDEFDAGRAATKRVSRMSMAPATQSNAERVPATDPRPEARGLCRTCARLSGCTFPKTAEGVWHCEEFE